MTMRFGMFVPQGWRLDLVDVKPARQWETMRELAQRADRGPWESLWVYDHFHTVPVPTDEATHEAWTLMAAFAASTERIRLGQMCTCMGYRNPAYLAKMAATVDVVSGGRLEMGIGAGWYEHEWQAYGYGFPRAGERLGMLDEGVQIMRRAWTEGRSTLDGTYFQVDGAICRPLPLQEGGIPIWLAGGGEKVTLRIAAKHAQGSRFMQAGSPVRYTNFGIDLDVFRHKSQVLAGHCEEFGSDFDSITRSADYNVTIGRTQAEVDAQLERIAVVYARYLPAEEVRRRLGVYVDSPTCGTVEQVIDAFGRLYEAGMTYAICYVPSIAHDTSGLDLLEQEVIPALA